MEGFGDEMILFSSSVILSCEMILMRSAFSLIACKVFSSMVKFNCVANRMARIIRKGSSLNVCAGSSRCSDDLFLNILYTIKRINQFSIIFFIQTYCQGIDGKISSFLIIFILYRVLLSGLRESKR